ncbi:MAG: DUF2244 domain-containing protein [Aquimonas sp.]|nr:DUF2244 domain-containing protein [Aquimonas sp.]
MFFALVIVTSVAVSGYSWWIGNIFAPIFAVLEIGVLMLAFWVVSQHAARSEVIHIEPERVSVSRLPELVEVLSSPPQWVRLEQGDASLVLTSGGRRVAVGRFLGEAERERLHKDLEQGLRLARVRAVHRSIEN